MVVHKFIQSEDTIYGKVLTYGTYIDGETTPTITVVLMASKLSKQVEIVKINALGYERSRYKYELIKYIINDFDSICNRFECDLTSLVCELYNPAEENDYFRITGMRSTHGLGRLFIMPFKTNEKNAILSLKKINVK